MGDIKKRAIQLRNQGKSYRAIHSILHVPKGTLSYWFRGIEPKNQSTGAARLVKRNKEQTRLANIRALRIRNAAAQQISKLSLDDLKFVGIALYWGEGYKRGAYGSRWRCVNFTNSDPEMVAVMMKFFLRCCKVPNEKIRIHLMLHNRAAEKKVKDFWSILTGIPLTQFVKTSFALTKASKRKRPPDRLPHGTVHIRIHDIQLFFQIIGWIEGLQKQLKKCE